MDKPYPFTPEQLAWLLDLETTTEPQTYGALHRLTRIGSFGPGYCCLGRGAVTLNLHETPWSDDDYLGSFGGSAVQLFAFRRLHLRGASGELADAVPPAPGVIGEGWQTLAEINDELKWTFPEIAAYIRANPWNVFTDPEASHDPK